MRSLAELNEHVDTFEGNTLTALEKIVVEQLPAIATLLEKHTKALLSLQGRIEALAHRPRWDE